MSVINTNIKAEMAISALRMNERPLAVAMQQMSTGKRINSARDDAAGLAIANWMTTEVRSLNQAIRNSTDAISLLQTADGASSEITEMLRAADFDLATLKFSEIEPFWTFAVNKKR